VSALDLEFLVGMFWIPMWQGAGPEGWRLGSDSGEPPRRRRARGHPRGGTCSRPGHSESIFIEEADHTCRRTRPSHQPSSPSCAQATTCTDCLRPDQRKGASTSERRPALPRREPSRCARTWFVVRGGDGLCTSKVGRTRGRRVGGLGEFDDRGDAPPRQRSMRCAPVARVFHDDGVGEHDDVAEVVAV
jgi:hypothetical protein